MASMGSNGLTYTRKLATEQATEELAASLAQYLRPGDVIVLDGDLGAGKTHFTKGLAHGMGITEEITSPTFNILQTYSGTDLDLNHFDLYRLDNPEQLDDIGFLDAVESDAVSVIEWGEKFPESLPLEYLEIRIIVDRGDDADAPEMDAGEVLGSAPRRIIVHSVGQRPRRLLFSWAQNCSVHLMKTTRW